MRPEELAYTYMSKVTNQLLKKAIKPDHEYNDVKDLNLEEIKKWKDEYYISGIILDIDGTMRKDMIDIDYRNIRWLLKLKEQFKICMVSNGIDKNVEKLAKKLDIGYISLAFKPLKKGFITAVNKMGLDPENVLVIGDEYLADIFGGQRMGMRTAVIKEAEIEER